MFAAARHFFGQKSNKSTNVDVKIYHRKNQNFKPLPKKVSELHHKVMKKVFFWHALKRQNVLLSLILPFVCFSHSHSLSTYHRTFFRLGNHFAMMRDDENAHAITL